MEISSSSKDSLINLALILTLLCDKIPSGHAQDGPTILFQRALFCFNNRLLYTGCNEAYRLNERGKIKVPSEETAAFCNGPCFAETELVLKCVDNVMSDFVFYNKATTRDIRSAITAGCSSTDERGIFDVGRYFEEGYIGKAGRSINLNSLYIFVSLVSFGFLTL